MEHQEKSKEINNLSSEEISEDKPPSLPEQFNNWHWQMQNRIKKVSDLSQLKITKEMLEAEAKFPMAITPYYASLIKSWNPSDPIFAMAIPQVNELISPSYLSDDPLKEDHDMPVPGLVHRYKDRALIITTDSCAMLCRFCTRKRVAGQTHGNVISPEKLSKIINYLTEHEEIHDVIISGGDAFTMSTDILEYIISSIRAVPSVDIIRIGTRVPVTMPMRVTDELVSMLKKYHPIFVNTHFNHPIEVTIEAKEACERLVNAGIPMGNQTVLLKGVNDNPQVIEELCRKLIKMRVRPYYLFQCDLVNGVEHFRTPLAKGIEIMEHLRGRLSGIAIPNFVVDAPNGGGKIELLPNYIVEQTPTRTLLRNFEGKIVSYPEPLS